MIYILYICSSIASILESIEYHKSSMFRLFTVLPVGDGMCIYIYVSIYIYVHDYMYVYGYILYMYTSILVCMFVYVFMSNMPQCFCVIWVQGANAEGPNIYPEEALSTVGEHV